MCMQAISQIIVLSASSLVVALPGYQNVLGGELQRCSGAGMALTGFTRNGHCVNRVDDAGSHHICIDMSSNEGGNFCLVTGQPDWCSSQRQCDQDPSAACPVTRWCVCEWAFARYIERAGGCGKIKRIVCEATNMKALDHYREQAVHSASIKSAFDCLEQRCKPASKAEESEILETANQTCTQQAGGLQVCTAKEEL